jgi:hypothetical protein
VRSLPTMVIKRPSWTIHRFIHRLWSKPQLEPSGPVEGLKTRVIWLEKQVVIHKRILIQSLFMETGRK